jgi:hypothetical protein
MMFGRLIRVRAHRRDPEATIYVVAETEVEKAIDILKVALARPHDAMRIWAALPTPS